MNEIIKELYTIEERASQITEDTQRKKQELQGRKQEKEELIWKELQGEMEGRLTILKTRMEEEADREIREVIQKNEVFLAALEKEYNGNYEKKAQEILERITEV